jgi:hypothetical protein
MWWGLVSSLNVHHNRCSKCPPSSFTHSSQRRRIEPLAETSSLGRFLMSAEATWMRISKWSPSGTSWHEFYLSTIPTNKNVGGQIGRTWRPGHRTSMLSLSIRKVIVEQISHSTCKVVRVTVELKTRALAHRSIQILQWKWKHFLKKCLTERVLYYLRPDYDLRLELKSWH